MKTTKISTDGPFFPNNHYRAYLSLHGTTAGRRTLDDRKGNPRQFKTRADAETAAHHAVHS